VDIEEFNAMGAAEAAAAVRPCVDIDSWVEAVVDGRPYADLDALLATSDRQATGWSGTEVEAALADHPRIGDRPTGSAASAEMSAREQSGVDPTDTDVQRRLADGNRRYEEKFGRIYLVRAAGRTAAEMLDLLELRLTNDPATELGVTKAQLAEIATLRLKALMS
jgi:2-oxo-4-hydroxy-4-carboxy-5-ureidoimidazoline decarboxylase